MKSLRFVIVLFILGFVASFFYLNWKNSTKDIESPTIPLPAAVLPPSRAREKISYQNAPSFLTPQKIPSASVKNAVNVENEAVSVSKKLGFTEKPAVAAGTRGRFIVWRQNSGSLTLTPDTQTIVYASGYTPQKMLLKPLNEYSIEAKKFLRLIFPDVSENEFKILSHEYFAPERGTAKRVSEINAATIIQINYVRAVNGYPLYGKGLGFKPETYIQLNSDLQVIMFSAKIFPIVTAGESFVSIIPYSEALKRLNRSEGVLINYKWGDKGEEPVLLPDPPTSLSVTKTEIAYYYDSDRNTVSPVYIFFGRGYSSNKELVLTTTVVDAQ